MNYKKIRLELFICINKLFFCLHDLYLDAEIIYEEIIKNKLSIEHINNISNFIFYNNMLINFTNNYEITILKCLDYKPNKNNLSKIENDYFIYKDLKNSNSKSEFDFYMEIYLDDLDNFKFRIMNVYDDIFNKLKCNKFYSDSNYKLTPNEEFYSLVFGYIINITCELAHREYIGYVLKIILNTHNYNLIRNSFAIYFDEHMDYPDYIKGILRFVTTFDENSFEYVDRYVKNTSSYLEYDSMPIEDFEIKDIESKYKFIMELINEKLEEIKKDEFVIDNIEYS